MKRKLVIFISAFLFLLFIPSPSSALSRDLQIRDARIYSNTNNNYNVNTVIIQAQGSQVAGNSANLPAYQTIAQIQKYIFELKQKLLSVKPK